MKINITAIAFLSLLLSWPALLRANEGMDALAALMAASDQAGTPAAPVPATGAGQGYAYAAGSTLAASDFEVYSLGFIQYSRSDFEGRAGAAGDAHFDNFSLGARQTGAAPTLIVGGYADLADGSILNGGVLAGGLVRAVRVDLHGRVTQRARVAELLAPVSAELLSAADRLAAMPARTAAAGPVLELKTETGALVSAVRLRAGALAGAGVIVLSVQAGQTLVVDVAGAEAALINKDIKLSGGGRVVFNFASARTLEIRGVAVPAVVLAPRAAVSFSSARIDGRLYAGSLRGNGQVNETGTAALAAALAGAGGQVAR